MHGNVLRILMTLLAGVLLAAGMAIAHPSVAWALHCDNIGESSDHICLFTGRSYDGNLSLIGDLGDGTCADHLDEGYQSYRNGTEFEGYLFEGDDCDGRSYPATSNTESPDIGFVAHSFKQTRVTGLPNILGGTGPLPIPHQR
ncbi:hypothetical protein GCM10023321_50190 [Pseudonocardia eucalypti]|uniref:Peptidase inhibitor family I36 n=1 Tax=Pseudonocardia eucalypti TaxID=648755 RepID=A0ABP9QKT8_9PSEU|nr:hypothetical protein [Pseudonocardia eucalypti]